MELPAPKSEKDRVLIVEGGGMRGAFASGVVAAMCEIFPSQKFDLTVGVSAGSCPLAFYVTDSPVRGESFQKILDIWKYDLIGNKFISFRNFFFGKKIMNQSYLIDYLMKDKYPIIKERLSLAETTPLYIVVSDFKEMVPRYIQATSENIHSLLKAATSLPIVTKGKYELNKMYYGDGGALDPIPLEKIINLGYKDITLVLNHPVDFFSKPIGKLISRIAYPFQKEFRRKVRIVHHRAYNTAKQIILNPPKGINLTIIEPYTKNILGITSTKKNKIHNMINKGWKEGLRHFSYRDID